MIMRLVPSDPLLGIPEVKLTERGLTIGRSRQNDVCLDDPSVSRVHARIRLLDGSYVMEDNGSLHGTLVNDKRIVSQLLAANDVIQVGIYRFRLAEDDAFSRDAITVAQDQVDHLRLLLDVTGMVHSSLDLGQALDDVIDAVIKVTHAERGFLMMLNDSGELETRVARNFDRTALSTNGIAASFSVVERVRRTGKSVVLSDVLNSDSSGPSQSIVELGLRSVMCVPLNASGGFLGLVYVDSRRETKEFSERDLETFHSLATQAALSIEKSHLYEELRRYSSSLEEQVKQRTAEVIQAEKMAAIGRLAAGIAHEINSPLGVIASNVDLLCQVIGRLETGESAIKGVDSSEIVNDIARSSRTAGERLRKIIKAFEAFTGLDQAALRYVDLNQVLDQELTLLEHEFKGGVRVFREFGNLKPVKCSPSRMHEAFMNLLVNAIQSLDGKGQVRVRSEQLTDRARITIQDTGKGMTKEQLAGAFDTGFARQAGRVTARLGLVITAQIVREHGGDIQLESSLGTGTTVTVLLPTHAS
jgi:signal transduction histidine kinase